DAAEGLVSRAGLQGLLQVPGDRLPFAVRVGGEVDGVGFLRRALQLRERLLLPVENLVGGLVTVIAVDSEALLRKVPDVAVGREHTEVLPEKLLERSRLCGRLDDYDAGHDGCGT